MNETMAYYFNPDHQGKPKIIIVWRFEQWRTSSLIAKGVNPSKHACIAQRNMIKSDYLDCSNRRLNVMYYCSWEHLISDEMKIKTGKRFLNKLIEASKKFKIINEGVNEN